ncbi:MAG: carbonic anhydrase [Planctomycetota bacterium]|nr:carbonic anhydrase [Planctomycetota bacterium]MDA1106216.1 carbonic anhydrase [Planctomycetota bacterium]
MTDLTHLLDHNRAWAARMEREQPGFFSRLVDQQRPKYLWIGCSDSRVPANQIVGLPPGEVFVHRNVANLVVHSDLNCMSVLDFAVNILGVRDIIVCGHYGCGGVKAALAPSHGRIVDHWVRHVRDIAKFYRDDLESQPSPQARERRLCELNVAVQVVHVRESPVLASDAAAETRVHGWIYDLADGLLADLTPSAESLRAVGPSVGLR